MVVENADERREGSCAVVCEIDPRGPANAAGIMTGDTILRVGRLQIRCREDILDASFFLTAGDPAEIEVFRDERRLVIETEPASHPSSHKTSLQAGMVLTAP